MTSQVHGAAVAASITRIMDGGSLSELHPGKAQLERIRAEREQSAETDAHHGSLGGVIARGLGRSLLLALMVVIVASGVLPRVIGAVPLAVLSGSMVPTFNPGDLVVSKPVADPAALEIGEVITFQPVSGDPMLITHRIIGFEFGSDGTRNIITQGDANSASDKAIVPDQVMGKMLYTVPFMGYVSNWVTALNLAWLLPIAGVALIVVCIVMLTRALRRRDRE
ncbi:signal peptidase, endoplasmic reticulum-type [Paramicrobacterium humi]|uniref:Signal peptidase I n=1 Tax=Paramicrobacterium humi TaxID=640635 RepID=A0A1H4N218_9MICO|nr:signal peptidase I [Microbacterium humi]SEB89137.1 signal peptidase, endoplasmic reticulum-type [Microbacterium humi]